MDAIPTTRIRKLNVKITWNMGHHQVHANHSLHCNTPTPRIMRVKSRSIVDRIVTEQEYIGFQENNEHRTVEIAALLGRSYNS